MPSPAAAKDLLQSTGSRSVLVALSGGKDSLVTLDLCVKSFEHVEAFLMYLVPNLRCVEMYVTWAEQHYDIRVHRVPHWLNSVYMRAGIFTVDRARVTERCKAIGLRDIETHVRKLSGIDWIAWGERGSDGMSRYARLKQCQGIERRFHRVFPIWDWKTESVYAYLRANRMPIPHMFGTRKQSSGAGFNTETLLWIHDNFPDDFEKIKAVYPFVQAEVERRNFAASRGGAPADAGPALRRRTVAARKHQGGPVQPPPDR